MRPSVLLVDDEAGGRNLLAGFLIKKGYDVGAFPDAETALEAFKKKGFDLALLDVKLPGMSGIELTKNILEIDPVLPVVLVTAYGGVETAIAGMKAGAEDYLTKPVDLEELELVMAKQLEKRRLETENRLLHEQLEEGFGGEIVAESKQMREVLSVVSRIAPTDAPVLICGESGVGKELIARAIHDASGCNGAFIPINCAALPDNLLESELFGAEPGAYTGANKRRRGKIELADSGTLFLDEFAEIPLQTQPKLLRFLQEGTFYRLGGTAQLAPTVRVIAATNRDIKSLVENGEMREDLYFRLAVITVEIPPLRERHEDLLKLTDESLKKFIKKHGKGVEGLSKEARDAILRHNWPGNVRELFNTLERAVILTRKKFITPDDLQMLDRATGTKSDLLVDVERAHIHKVLEATEWHLGRAAERLGIHRNTLRNKIAEYNLSK